ncbi:MAG: RdgB/HAM1 family non-canonical purine NTP pyrophosphatase [Clostridiales bacterium]|nr:RdgB/HAM1 family non-canonical purine NTP pyrophosphatase [Clostridiales bacterium]
MKRIVVATNNRGKIDEIKSAMAGMPFDVLGMREINIELDVEETGSTFIENATLKAKALHKMIGGYVLADDSGLCVDALNGAPGIYSSRFFGEETTYRQKFTELSRLLNSVPLNQRTAHFSCAMVLIRDDADTIVVEEHMHGVLLNVEFGGNGFGYDPIFYVPEYGRTVAQLSFEEKNSISHRGKAIRSLLDKISAS